MTKIAILIQQTPALEDGNYLRLGNALRQLGHHVSCCFVDSLALNNGRLEANGFVIEQNLQKNAPFPPATLHQLGAHGRTDTGLQLRAPTICHDGPGWLT